MTGETAARNANDSADKPEGLTLDSSDIGLAEGDVSLGGSNPSSQGEQETSKGLLPLCNALSDSVLPILQPTGLRLNDALRRHGLEAQWATKTAQHKLAFAVHVVVEAAYRFAGYDSPAFFVPLHSRRLATLLGTRYAPRALQTLKAMDIIEADERYSTGRFSKSYRLAERYWGAGFSFRTIESKVLARKVRRDDLARSLDAVGSDEARAVVWQSLRSLRITDEGRALVAAKAYRSSQQQAAWLLALRDFTNGWRWFRADHDTGRVFHNVTQCPRELRQHLTIEGEPVAEVDIGAAQPFFALSLLPPEHKDRKAWAEFAASDDFYASLFMRLGAKDRRPWGTHIEAWAQPGNTHRERFKRYVARHVLFDTIASAYEVRPIMDAVGSVSVYLACELAARRSTKAGASALARELQRHEAGLILGKVIPRIRAELTECKPISIHDGILCQTRFAEQVATIVRQESFQRFGAMPAVRIKGVTSCSANQQAA